MPASTVVASMTMTSALPSVREVFAADEGDMAKGDLGGVARRRRVGLESGVEAHAVMHGVAGDVARIRRELRKRFHVRCYHHRHRGGLAPGPLARSGAQGSLRVMEPSTALKR